MEWVEMQRGFGWRPGFGAEKKSGSVKMIAPVEKAVVGIHEVFEVDLTEN